MQRITLSVDDDLVEALDRHMRRRRYGSGSAPGTATSI